MDELFTLSLSPGLMKCKGREKYKEEMKLSVKLTLVAHYAFADSVVNISHAEPRC